MIPSQSFSILWPHSEPEKLFKWCRIFSLLATCSTETLWYTVHWRYSTQKLRTASTPIEVTRRLTVWHTDGWRWQHLSMSGEERKRQRTARSRSSEEYRRLLINFNRNATYQGKQASVKTGLNRILRLLKQLHRLWQLSRNALGLYPLVGGSAVVISNISSVRIQEQHSAHRPSNQLTLEFIKYFESGQTLQCWWSYLSPSIHELLLTF